MWGSQWAGVKWPFVYLLIELSLVTSSYDGHTGNRNNFKRKGWWRLLGSWKVFQEKAPLLLNESVTLCPTAGEHVARSDYSGWKICVHLLTSLHQYATPMGEASSDVFYFCFANRVQGKEQGLDKWNWLEKMLNAYLTDKYHLIHSTNTIIH